MKKLLLFLCLIFLTLPRVAVAGPQDNMDYRAFAALPVLHEGRIKPLDSFARIELRRIYGGETLNGQNAIIWLAHTLFDPGTAAQDRIFVIRDPALKQKMGLEGRTETVFSLEDISPGLEATKDLIPPLLAPDAQPTPEQKSLLDLHENALTLIQIMGTLGMVLPLDETGRTWMDLKKTEPSLTEKIKSFIARKGANPETFTEQETLAAVTGMKMEMLNRAGLENTMVRIMPPEWAGAGDEWLSPWQSLLSGKGSPAGAAWLDRWQGMADSWRASDAAAWKKDTAAAADAIATSAPRGRLKLEVFYNRIDPLNAAGVVYLIALALIVAALWQNRTDLNYATAVAAFFALALHAAGIILRIAILARPPVGTLYESLLFVSFVVCAAGAAAELFRRDRMALLGGFGCGLALLTAAPLFAPNGDSLEMLVAVLNTGFWLSTHVICITVGYGVSLLAAILAHFALLRGDGVLDRAVHKTLIAALFLTAFGTMLGGIWADQSWGRFWGWDPKENGALLIVLWITWVLHGRWGGYLRDRWFLAASAFLTVIVALAWFGVNLLNVGLHSYGFTEKMALGLAAFCAFETLIIGLMVRKS